MALPLPLPLGGPSLGGPGGPPQSIQIPGPGGPGGAGIPGQPDNAQAARDLDAAINAIQSFLQNEEDEQDKSVAAQVLAKLHSIQGARAKEKDAALGVTPALKFARRNAG